MKKMLLKSQNFYHSQDLCDWWNNNNVEIVSISSYDSRTGDRIYTLFYYGEK
jgi:hypothetical protein